MTSLSRASAVGLLGVLAALSVCGCGSGGGRLGAVTGLVTDVDGKPVAGARVSGGGRSTISLSNGTFTLDGIPNGYRTFFAEITIRGLRWNGETVVDVAEGERNRTINIVVAPESEQGRIAGRVIGPGGGGLAGAKVFVGGPWASTLAVTDGSGFYEVRRLTGNVRYTVTASLAGYVNQTQTDQLVLPNQTRTVSFALARGSSLGPIPAPSNVSAQAWTIAASISRADSRTKNVYEWLKRLYRKKKGLPDGPQARQIERMNPGRATPEGAVVEIDLFWDYQSFNDLLGYAIRRGVSPSALSTAAVLRDPLAAVFFDVDPALTPDVVYYYTVHRLDTIDFPDRGTLGPPSSLVNAQPLNPIRALDPVEGQFISGNPTFAWTRVNGATNCTLYLWDRFPDLQSSTDPDGVTPIWTTTVNQTGSGVQEKRYDGPGLASGTYYWMVVAADAGDNNLSATQIAKFRK